MRTTKEQRDYIRMLENVMPEKDILVSLKDNDDELRWYLRRQYNGYQRTCELIKSIDKSMDFWMSVGDNYLDTEGILLELGIVNNQQTVAKYQNRVPWVAWTWISSTRGLTQWFIEKCKRHIEWNCLRIDNTTLTEDFMRKHKDKLDWDDIALTQNMSDEFMEEFEDRLDVDLLFKNPKISDSRINNLIFNYNGRFGKRKDKNEK